MFELHDLVALPLELMGAPGQPAANFVADMLELGARLDLGGMAQHGRYLQKDLRIAGLSYHAPLFRPSGCVANPCAAGVRFGNRVPVLRFG